MTSRREIEHVQLDAEWGNTKKPILALVYTLQV